MLSAEAQERRLNSLAYLSQRRSDYAFRCKRYAAVHDHLALREGDIVLDIGAGTQDFGRYLKSLHWKGLYLPVDGAIDGTNLETWEPPLYADYLVAIEVLEHLHDPWRLVALMEKVAIRGCVITTPNSLVVDTLGIDPTHVTPLYEEQFIERGWSTDITSLFCKPDDTIIAWYSK